MMTRTDFPTVNPKFTADLVNPCPACGELSLETAYQPPLMPKAGREGYTLCHCKNPDCERYAETLDQTEYLKASKQS